MVKDIVGLDGYLAFTTYNRLLISLQSMPDYAHLPYRVLYSDLQNKSSEEMQAILKELLMLIDLDKDEVLNLVRLATDSNGVGYTGKNLKNIKPEELLDIMLDVCTELSKIKVKILTSEELAALPEFSVDVRSEIIRDPTLSTEAAVNLAFARTNEVTSEQR